jgi:hypothetical protein
MRTVTKLLLYLTFTTAACYSFTSQSLASDLAVKAPAPIVRPPDWVPMFGDFLGTTRIDNAFGILRGSFKISENESPRPTDRVFFTYNYFNNLFPDSNSGTNVHRESFGFEKTFLDGNASFGMRLPFIQFQDRNDVNAEAGDLSFIFKYAFINTPTTAVSTGLVISMPTGTLPFGFDVATNGEIHSAVFQPYAGITHNFTPDFFVQGFTSFAIPTDSRDVTIWHNSVGAGYWIYRAPPTDTVSGVIPMLEVHVNTPLNQLDAGVPEPLDTTVNLTGGVRIQFLGKTSLGIGVSVPVVGPKAYDVEALAQLNLRF